MIRGLTIQKSCSIECLTIGLKRCGEVSDSFQQARIPASLVRLNGQGQESPDVNEFWYIPAPFRFCLNCGVSYGFREKSEFWKADHSWIGRTEHRHDALCLSVLRNIKKQSSIPEKARKLLSFTDNRQDASLQAGHFNDFIEISILRAALYQPYSNVGTKGFVTRT